MKNLPQPVKDLVFFFLINGIGVAVVFGCVLSMYSVDTLAILTNAPRTLELFGSSGIIVKFSPKISEYQLFSTGGAFAAAWGIISFLEAWGLVKKKKWAYHLCRIIFLPALASDTDWAVVRINSLEMKNWFFEEDRTQKLPSPK